VLHNSNNIYHDNEYIVNIMDVLVNMVIITRHTIDYFIWLIHM